MRPKSMLINSTLYWTIRLYTEAGILVDADSTPTVAVRKGPDATADVVTVTKRAATTGIYDCSYNPTDEAEGDQFTIEETVVIDEVSYPFGFNVVVFAAERGTNSALLASGYTAPANSDITAIKAKTDTIPASPAAVSDIPTTSAIANALLDLADAIETGLTPRQAIRLQLAALAGKLSGAGTGTEVFRNAVADSKVRITATVDGDGNRTAITTDAT